MYIMCSQWQMVIFKLGLLYITCELSAEIIIIIKVFIFPPPPYVSLKFITSQYHVNYTARHRTTPYRGTSYLLMLPLYSWWSSIPFLCKTKLWESNVDDFRLGNYRAVRENKLSKSNPISIKPHPTSTKCCFNQNNPTKSTSLILTL